MNRQARALLRFRAPILAGWLLITAAAGAVLLQGFAIDNSVGVWFPKDDPALGAYERYLEDFGESEWTLLMLEGESVAAPEFVRDLETLASRLEELPHVERVVSRQDLRANDDRHVVLLLQTANFIERQDAYRIALVDGIHAAAENCPSVTGHSVAGASVINAELNRSARRDMFVFCSLVTFLIFGISVVLLRSARDALVLLSVAGSTVVVALGLIVLCGYSLNMITIMLPTVLLALSVADVIHVIHAFHQHRSAGSTRGAVGRVVEDLWRPCLATSVTTVVGFLSLSGSSVLPIFQLAVFSSFGIAVAYLLSMTVAPLLLHQAWREHGGVVAARKPRSLNWPRLRPAAVVVGLLVAGAPLLGLGRLEADTNYVEFFRAGAAVPEAYRKISEAGFPQDQLVLVQKAPADADLIEKLRALPQVKGVLGPDPDPEGGWVRLVLMTDFLGSRDVHRLMHSVRRIDTGGDLTITGTTVLLASMDTKIIETQVRSIFIVSAAILLVLAVSFRSLRLAVVGWLVSLFPVAFVLGVMGILGVTINMATVLIAGIALGIAVDDTIHFVFCYRERARAGSRRAVEHALSTVGPRIILTSLILMGGFGSMAISEYLPTANFGMFSCLTIFAALVMDLTVLPLALRIGSPSRAPV